MIAESALIGRLMMLLPFFSSTIMTSGEALSSTFWRMQM